MFMPHSFQMFGGAPTDYEIFYTMDNISGSSLIDEAGNHDAIISGASQVTGYHGDALNFDGVNDEVVITGYPVPSVFSASFWIETSNLSGDNMCMLGEDKDFSITAELLFLYANTSFGTANNNIRLYTDAEVFVGSDIRNTGWRHIVLIRDSSDWSLYLDAVLDGSGVSNATLSGDIVIGNSDIDALRPLDGKIDEFKIYERVLTFDEVYSLYREYG